MRLLAGCVLVMISVACAEIPANFPKCHNGDSECMKNAANSVIKQYYAGLSEVNLLRFDPLRIKSLTLERNPNSPVNVDLKFKDTDLIGLKDMKILSFTGLKADLSGRTVVEAEVPEVILRGTYTMDGRVLLLPIVGQGPCTFTLKNLRIKFSTDSKPVERDGKIYGVLEHVKLELDPELVHFNLENLFNGDKTLGDNMNQVLNASWKEVFGELKPSFSKGIGLIVKQLLTNFFDKHPYADHFLQNKD